jgi:hypothetical protein
MLKNKEKNNKKNIYIELSNNYISYKIDNQTNIDTIKINSSLDDNLNNLLTFWYDTIYKILNSFDFDFKLVLLFKSENLMIKNSKKELSSLKEYEYFANALACSEGEIEVKHINNNSYTIVKTKFLKEILFKFKDYEIESIYDISTLASYKIREENSFYMDLSLGSFDIILNKNIIQKRSFTFNLSNLIKSVAKVLYTDEESTLLNLKKGFKEIYTYEQLLSSNKPVEKAIKEFVDELERNISTTLSYFSIYDSINQLDKIYINGDILEFDFLINILKTKFNIEIIPFSKQLNISNLQKININIISELEEEILRNTKLKLDGINYTDGRNEFIFIENRFVAKKNLNKKQNQKLNTIQKVRIENRKNIEQEKEFDKSILKMSMGELYEYILYKLRFVKESNNRVSNNFNFDSNNSLYLLVLLPILIISSIYFSFIFISEKEDDFNLQISSLDDRVTRVDKLKNQLSKLNENFLIQNDELNKIFWTQKIVTLANLMPNEIWLSSVNLVNNTRQIENKEVTSKVLVLEARALPSSIGHIASIANYMQNLLTADNEFKKDFVDIRFGGASIIKEYGYDVIEFKLLCNFEKNINIKNIETKKVDEDNIGENIQNISKFKEKQIETLENLGN